MSAIWSSTSDPQYFKVWIRTSPLTTAHVRIQAENGYEAQSLAEAQYGRDNVISVTNS